jgi:hypothetical protein
MVGFYDYFDDHFGPWLKGFESYCKNKGHIVEINVCRKRITESELTSKRYDFVMIWNGEMESTSHIKHLCRKLNIPHRIVEVGWFPQRSNYFVDTMGINGHGSLMSDDLSWITDAHIKSLEDFKKKYIGGKPWVGGENILCPLQLEGDTNILKFSPFKKMQALINYVERIYPEDKIIFKGHPLDPNSIKVTCSAKNKVTSTGNFLDIARYSKRVIGINSTCLLESLMLGAPTTSLGIGYVNSHTDRVDKLLAALIDKQIPVGSDKLDKWFGTIL